VLRGARGADRPAFSGAPRSPRPAAAHGVLLQRAGLGNGIVRRRPSAMLRAGNGGAADRVGSRCGSAAAKKVGGRGGARAGAWKRSRVFAVGSGASRCCCGQGKFGRRRTIAGVLARGSVGRVLVGQTPGDLPVASAANCRRTTRVGRLAGWYSGDRRRSLAGRADRRRARGDGRPPPPPLGAHFSGESRCWRSAYPGRRRDRGSHSTAFAWLCRNAPVSRRWATYAYVNPLVAVVPDGAILGEQGKKRARIAGSGVLVVGGRG